MPTFALFPGARPGSTIGTGDVAMSAFLLSRISQMRRYEPAPLTFHGSLPALVIGTVMRGDDQLALREEREQRADRARGRDIGVIAPRQEYVEVVDAHVAQSCVDVVRAEHMPKGERRAVIGDRDHRFERLVECELGSRDLE